MGDSILLEWPKTTTQKKPQHNAAAFYPNFAYSLPPTTPVATAPVTATAAAVSAAPIPAIATVAPVTSVTTTAATATAAIPALRLFYTPAFEHSLTTHAHLAAFDIDDHRRQLIAQVGNVFDFIDPIVGQLTDVNHAIHAGQDIDEGAIRLDPHHCTGVDLAQFDLFGHVGDLLQGLFRLDSFAGDIDCTVFFNVDLDAILFL